MNIQSNALFTCDALLLLERIPSNSVQLIYLNPPWISGSSKRPKPENHPSLTDEQYTAYVSKIIQQAWRVLARSGNLFVQWTPEMSIDVRLVMNQVFSEPVEEIALAKRRGNSIGPGPKIDNEFILVSRKSKKFVYSPIYLPLSSEAQSSYSGSDARGAFRGTALAAPLNRPQARFIWQGHQPPQHSSWRFSVEKLDALVSEDRIYFPSSGGLPQLKQYLADNLGVEIGNDWTDLPAFHPRQVRGQPIEQRQLALMKRIVQYASNGGDLILDPFCGSGVTLVAAQSFGRLWWGADVSLESRQILESTLESTFALKAYMTYDMFSEAEVLRQPVMHTSYRVVIATTAEIAVLQGKMFNLTERLLSLKKLMNVTELDGETLENAIDEMERLITASLTNQLPSLDSYLKMVCVWFSGWDRLDAASQSFLPLAELIFESIDRAKDQDYSMFILQYCRALENELLKKVFVAYADDVHARHPDLKVFLEKDFQNEKTKVFAKAIEQRNSTYTLGTMNFYMGLLKVGGKTLKGSALLQDFRSFAVCYFGERIVEQQYLDQIDRINRDFRCKAAHPYVLDSELAENCRKQVISCLDELILNYQGGVGSDSSD